MAKEWQVSVAGHRELRRAIRQTKDRELTAGLKDAHKQTAAVVVPPARADVPVKSGRLSASIKPSSTVKGAVIRAGTPGRVPYAGPIHFGWRARNIKPRPFLFRAAGRTHEKYRAVFEKLISDLVRRFIGSD